MGTDIHAVFQKKVNGDWVSVDFYAQSFDDRNYRLFEFLAGVRGYSGITPLSQPRGLPADFFHDKDLGDHSFSWFLLSELENFDYSGDVEDRRVTRQIAPNFWDSGCTCNPGEGVKMPWRDFLGVTFFEDMERLKSVGVERVVFGFDS